MGVGAFNLPLRIFIIGGGAGDHALYGIPDFDSAGGI
jgi:hypothetical protein